MVADNLADEEESSPSASPGAHAEAAESSAYQSTGNVISHAEADVFGMEDDDDDDDGAQLQQLQARLEEEAEWLESDEEDIILDLRDKDISSVTCQYHGDGSQRAMMKGLYRELYDVLKKCNICTLRALMNPGNPKARSALKVVYANLVPVQITNSPMYTEAEVKEWRKMPLLTRDSQQNKIYPVKHCQRRVHRGVVRLIGLIFQHAHTDQRDNNYHADVPMGTMLNYTGPDRLLLIGSPIQVREDAGNESDGDGDGDGDRDRDEQAAGDDDVQLPPSLDLGDAFHAATTDAHDEDNVDGDGDGRLRDGVHDGGDGDGDGDSDGDGDGDGEGDDEDPDGDDEQRFLICYVLYCVRYVLSGMFYKIGYYLRRGAAGSKLARRECEAHKRKLGLTRTVGAYEYFEVATELRAPDNIIGGHFLEAMVQRVMDHLRLRGRDLDNITEQVRRSQQLITDTHWQTLAAPIHRDATPEDMHAIGDITVTQLAAVMKLVTGNLSLLQAVHPFAFPFTMDDALASLGADGDAPDGQTDLYVAGLGIFVACFICQCAISPVDILRCHLS